MKKNYSKDIFIFFSIAILSFNGFAQNQPSVWSQSNPEIINNEEVSFYKEVPRKSSFFNVNVNVLSSILSNAPNKGSSVNNSNLIIQFPNTKGKFESFRVIENSIMEPRLAASYPKIKTYLGVGVENSAATLRITITPEKGLNATIFSEDKTVFIEPYTNDLKNYIVFSNSIGDVNTDNFICETESVLERSGISDEEYIALKNADDGRLRTYRLALACTVEYAQFHGGTTASVMAAMTNTMNRVNGVYVRDLGLTMTMVDNSSIIFLGPNTSSDPYTNNDGGAMLNQNQSTIDNNIGSANYDVGHVFSTGGGGVATLNSPCTGSKARGVTGLSSPVGDAFDIDYVAHEFGHQFGGNHTQNNSCQRSGVSVEVGSGSSIMGYAGICPPNVQGNSDDYFNGENIKEMWINISNGNSSSCGTSNSSGNSAPTANAGADFSIPPSTAFKLTGVSMDDNTGNTLTYSWEQNDTTPAPMPPAATNTGGPSFRSLDPKTVPVRFFPDFSTVLTGSLASTWEVVPSVARTMGFLFTVRDNAPEGGNTQSDEMTITVEDVTPFTVVTPPSWDSGSTQTVNWVVGQTNNTTINCQTVNILYTNDEGISYTTLASGVPNSGSASITVPNIASNNNSRILVEAADNVFYSLSDVFSLSSNANYSITNTTGSQSVCNIDNVSYNFTYSTSNGFSETATFSSSVTPAIPNANFAFTPTSLNTDGVVTLDVTGLIGATPGDYTITVTITTPSSVKTETTTLTISDSVCTSAASSDDGDRITRVIFNTINNVTLAESTDDPYQDFTSISTDIDRGSNYDITVNVNSNGNYYYINKVWIDWNQNCSFADPGEEYNLGTAENVVDVATSNSPLTISVPNDAVLGMTRMRVGMKYSPVGSNELSPCDTSFFGQVEDYTVNVIGSLSIDEFQLNNISIYPNPTNGELNVKLNTRDDINISILDIRGRRVYNKFNNNKTLVRTINVSSLASGMYLLNIDSNGNRVNKKIIIE